MTAAGQLPPRQLGLTLPAPQRASPGPMHRLPGSRPASEDPPRLRATGGLGAPPGDGVQALSPACCPSPGEAFLGGDLTLTLTLTLIQTSSTRAPAAAAWTEWGEVGLARKTLQRRGGLARLRGPSPGHPTLPSWGQLPAAHATHLPLWWQGPRRQGHEDLPVPWTQESCDLPGPCHPSGSVSAGLVWPSVSRDKTSSRSGWTAGKETAGNGRT